MQQGDRFGSYILEEKLAAGGMAEIFRARRMGVAGFARQVCIKRILPSLCTDKGFVDMFVDEARTGAQLRHGNIVAIDDFGEVDGQYYLCMELVSGVDLWRLERRLSPQGVAVPVSVGVHLAGEVLRALDYAHRKLGPDGAALGIVHRDVSPQNVLVSFAGEVKLTDFGIARAASRLHQTQGNVVKGKLSYMAPEQVYGYPLDARLDLFALGVVLFELLAGHRPFRGSNEAEVVNAILHGQRARLRETRPDVPPAFEAVLDRLLASDRDQRYPSASAALSDLATLQTGVAGARLLSGLMGFLYPEHSSAVRDDAAGFRPSMLVRVAAVGATAATATTPPGVAEPTTDPLEATVLAQPVVPDAADDDDTATRVDASPSLEAEALDEPAPPTKAAAPVLAERAAAAVRSEGPRDTSGNEPTRTMLASGLGDVAAPAAVAPRAASPTRSAAVGSAQNNGRTTMVLAGLGVLLVVGAATYALLGMRGARGPDHVRERATAQPAPVAHVAPAVVPVADAAPVAPSIAHDAAPVALPVAPPVALPVALVAHDAAAAAAVDAAAAAPAPLGEPASPRGLSRTHHGLTPHGHITTQAPF